MQSQSVSQALFSKVVSVGTIVALLAGARIIYAQPTVEPSVVTDEFVILEYTRTKKVLLEVQRTMDLILQRRVVHFRIDLPNFATSIGNYSSITPSALYAVLRSQPRNVLAQPFTQLLEQTQARAPFSSLYQSGCADMNGEERGTQELDPAPFAPSEAWEKLSKRLDVSVQIKIEPCPVARSQRLNNPDAGKPTNSNSKAIASETAKRFYYSLADAFRVGPSERIDFMIGQAYFFEDTEDHDIVLSSYLSASTHRAFAQALRVLMPHALQSKALELVFNRATLENGGRFSADRKGWFNARELGEKIYVSPTLVRAGLVSCAATMSWIPTLLYQLEKEELPQFRKRAISRDDFLHRLRTTEGALGAIDQCMLNQLGFVFAHELAHSLLLIKTEERADCVARAVQRSQGWPDSGLFRTLIFSVSLSKEAPLLGVAGKYQDELQCRAKIDREDHSNEPRSLDAAIAMCLARPLRCINGPEVQWNSNPG